MGRVIPVGGLTYFDANMGRIVTEGPDVCDYKARLRELDPTLSAYYDQMQEEWIVTFWDEKMSQDTFVLSDPDLGIAYERTCRAKNDRPGAMTGDELATKFEKEQEAVEDENMQKFRNIAGDCAERLTHALQKDGFFDHENIYGPKPKPALAARATALRSERRPV